MMLTDLAETLRASDLTVVEVSGWKTRGHGEMTDVQTIVCHHTAGPKTGEAPSLPVVRDGRSDLPGPLSHFVLGRSGTWYVVAAGLCYHAGAVRKTAYSNAYAIGVEAEAHGVPGTVTDWPEVQMVSYARGCAALAKRYGLADWDVLGHKEVCEPTGRKPDPDFDMGAFRARVREAMKGADMAITDDEWAKLRYIVRAEIAADHAIARPWLSQSAAAVAEKIWPGITEKGIDPEYLLQLLWSGARGNDAALAELGGGTDQVKAAVAEVLAAVARLQEVAERIEGSINPTP